MDLKKMIVKSVHPTLKKYENVLIGKDFDEANQILTSRIFKCEKTNCIEIYNALKSTNEKFTKNSNYQVLFSGNNWGKLSTSNRAILFQWQLEKMCQEANVPVPYMTFLSPLSNDTKGVYDFEKNTLYISPNVIFNDSNAMDSLFSLYHETYHYLDECNRQELYNEHFDKIDYNNLLHKNYFRYIDIGVFDSELFQGEIKKELNRINEFLYICQPVEKNANVYALEKLKNTRVALNSCNSLTEEDSEKYIKIKRKYEYLYLVYAPLYLGEDYFKAVDYTIDFLNDSDNPQVESLYFVDPKQFGDCLADYKKHSDYSKFFVKLLKEKKWKTTEEKVLPRSTMYKLYTLNINQEDYQNIK